MIKKKRYFSRGKNYICRDSSKPSKGAKTTGKRKGCDACTRDDAVTYVRSRLGCVAAVHVCALCHNVATPRACACYWIGVNDLNVYTKRGDDPRISIPAPDIHVTDRARIIVITIHYLSVNRRESISN